MAAKHGAHDTKLPSLQRQVPCHLAAGCAAWWRNTLVLPGAASDLKPALVAVQPCQPLLALMTPPAPSLVPEHLCCPQQCMMLSEMLTLATTPTPS